MCQRLRGARRDRLTGCFPLSAIGLTKTRRRVRILPQWVNSATSSSELVSLEPRSIRTAKWSRASVLHALNRICFCSSTSGLSSRHPAHLCFSTQVAHIWDHSSAVINGPSRGGHGLETTSPCSSRQSSSRSTTETALWLLLRHSRHCSWPGFRA